MPLLGYGTYNPCHNVAVVPRLMRRMRNVCAILRNRTWELHSMLHRCQLDRWYAELLTLRYTLLSNMNFHFDVPSPTVGLIGYTFNNIRCLNNNFHSKICYSIHQAHHSSGFATRTHVRPVILVCAKSKVCKFYKLMVWSWVTWIPVALFSSVLQVNFMGNLRQHFSCRLVFPARTKKVANERFHERKTSNYLVIR